MLIDPHSDPLMLADKQPLVKLLRKLHNTFVVSWSGSLFDFEITLISQFCFFFCIGWISFHHLRALHAFKKIFLIMHQKHLLQNKETPSVLDGVFMEMTIFTLVQLVVHQSSCTYTVNLSSHFEKQNGYYIFFSEFFSLNYFYWCEVPHCRGLVCFALILKSNGYTVPIVNTPLYDAQWMKLDFFFFNLTQWTLNIL